MTGETHVQKKLLEVRIFYFYLFIIRVSIYILKGIFLLWECINVKILIIVTVFFAWVCLPLLLKLRKAMFSF